MRAIREVDDDLYIVEMCRPVGVKTDRADRAKFSSGYRFCRTSGRAENVMAGFDEAAAQRATDETGCAGHENARQAPPLSACDPNCVTNLPANTLERRRYHSNAQPFHVAVRDITTSLSPPPVLDELERAQPLKLLFLVTEDWYFCSHRLPIARAAQAAGFAVVVATRVRAHGDRIREAGFALRPIAWRRRGDGFVGAGRAISKIARIYRAERPDLVHHIALKPVLFGGIARRLAFAGSAEAPVVVDSITGLGSGFSYTSLAARLRRPWLGIGLRTTTGRERGWVVVQNPEDRTALIRLGLDPGRIAMIRGSGVDPSFFLPLPDPQTPTVTVALVSRMLREKGVLEAIAAIRLLRARGMPVELLLAGPTDLDNRGSLTVDQLSSFAAEPGIDWLGPVADVREVWRRAAIAVLPSTYGEGVPKALLEAAACARPIVATDVPGCREVVRPGETGFLVAPKEVEGLAAAIAALVGDPARRVAMGSAGRALIESEFAENLVARETLAVYRAALDERVTRR
jgi:glycosyltransferase involved in cell wall biosynthesis